MIFATVSQFESALATLPAAQTSAIEAAQARQCQLTKPMGSLGLLEDIAVHFAGWQGQEIPTLQRGSAVIFAGSHGITAQGVSAYPDSVNAQMVANFHTGGAAINALTQAAGLDLQILTLDLDRPTADFTMAPAMSVQECLEALSAGAASVNPNWDLFIPGEMGIGNTTVAAALCTHLYGGDALSWVGAGTGVDEQGKLRKAAVIETALRLHKAPLAETASPAFETLRRLGGREVAAMAGAVLQARHYHIPVLLDGFISCAAIAPLFASNARITEHCLAGHCSAEPGHSRLLQHLDLSPLLRLDMRLGEGSGAAVAAQIIRSALAAHAQMATFSQAGVSGAA